MGSDLYNPFRKYGALWTPSVQGGSPYPCSDCCGEELGECWYCKDDKSRRYYDVTLPELANDNCSNCADYAGTYRIDMADNIVSGSWCRNWLTVDDDPCSESSYSVNLTFNLDPSGNVMITVLLSGDGHYWRLYTNESPDDFDCMLNTKIVIPYIEASPDNDICGSTVESAEIIGVAA